MSGPRVRGQFVIGAELVARAGVVGVGAAGARRLRPLPSARRRLRPGLLRQQLSGRLRGLRLRTL